AAALGLRLDRLAQEAAALAERATAGAGGRRFGAHIKAAPCTRTWLGSGLRACTARPVLGQRLATSRTRPLSHRRAPRALKKVRLTPTSVPTFVAPGNVAQTRLKPTTWE